jgi:hypothetical protein
MKPLKTEFRREGFDYRQIWRQGDVAVYAYGIPERYELIIIRIEPEDVLPDKSVLPLREAYPRTSQWGQYGWTLGPKDRALAIHIGKSIVDLPVSQRIAKIHAIMDRWIETRKSLERYGDG